MVSNLLRFRPSLLIAGTARRVVAPYDNNWQRAELERWAVGGLLLDKARADTV